MRRPILFLLMAMALLTWTGCTYPDEGYPEEGMTPRPKPSSTDIPGIIK